MSDKYTHDEKLKLAGKIKKIKKKEDMARILNIILEDNPKYMENKNGMFMFFHKLEPCTYAKIEKELRLINKKSKCYTDSINSESVSEKKEYVPYIQDEFPSQQGMSPKLKFSNREKSLIKRRRYDKHINVDVSSDVLYTSFNVDSVSDTAHGSESERRSESDAKPKPKGKKPEPKI